LTSSDPRGVLQLRTDDVTWREVDGEVVVLNLRSASYFAVDPSAAALWRALVQGTTRDHLIRELMVEQGVDEPTAAADVDTFIESCRASGLLAH